MAIAASKNWPIYQLDINNAFLYGDLLEEVYMDIPLVVYVDDILLTGNHSHFIVQVKAVLHEKFSIKDLGQAKYYLGLEISRNDEGLVLSQQKFTLDMLSSTKLLDAKPLSIPLDQNIILFDNIKSGALVFNHSLYRSLVGKLLYLTFTHPDISFCVHLLSQFMQAPREKHFAALLCVLRYLKCTVGLGLFFPVQSDLVLQGFRDSDWGCCTITGRSVTCFYLKLGSSLISWQAKKQSVTSKSTKGAEYRALASITTEIMWLKYLLVDLQVPVTNAVVVYCDNQAAVEIANNPFQHARTKHIELDCHFIREKVQAGIISPQRISSKDQLADIFTKALREARLDDRYGTMTDNTVMTDSKGIPCQDAGRS
ncbi:hypothetical protein AgCh_039367 [Apium graveolens]